MGRPRPEFAIVAAAIGVPLAIGIAAWQRGERVLGGACLAVAVGIAAWKAWEWWRATR